MKLYAETEDRLYVLSANVEKDAEKAGETVDEYVNETAKINPQFKRVYVE